MIGLIMEMNHRSNKKLKLAQINLMRSDKALYDLQEFQKHAKFDLALVSEPPITQGKMIITSRGKIL